jgi:replicative DNA helicase
MSDPYMLFVASALGRGREGIQEAVSAGILPEFLKAEPAAKAFRFLTEYVRQYDGEPDALVVEGETAVIVPKPPAQPLAYWIDKIKEIHLNHLLKEFKGPFGDALEREEPYEALDMMQKANVEIREQQLSTIKVLPMLSLVPDVLAHYLKIQGGLRGVPFPWKAVNEETLGMWPEDLILFAARTSVGKCVTASTRIVDPRTGLERTIEEIYRDPGASQVLSWSSEGGVHRKRLSAKVDTGWKECLRFTLNSGRSVEVTPEHPFMTSGGWRRADELEVDQTIGVPSFLPLPSESEQIDPSELDLLALFLADGSCTGHHVSITKADPEVIRIATRASEALGAVCKHVPKTKYTHAFVGREGHSNPVLALLRKHGVYGKLSKKKTIPEVVFRLSVLQLCNFLSLFWMCDGYVDQGGPGVTLASQEMIRQLQHLLLRVGVQSQVRYKRARCNGKVFDAWRLRVLSPYWPVFAERLTLWGKKEARLQKKLKPNMKYWSGDPSVGAEFKARVSEIVRKARSEGQYLNDFGVSLGRKSRYMLRDLYSKSGKRLRLSVFKKWARFYGVENEFAWLWSSDLYWDAITAIEPIGEQKVYDLTVPDTHCFIANDVLVHNTWALILLALTAWKAGHRVLFVSTEMAQLTIVQRFLAMQLQLPYRSFRRGELDIFSEKRFFDAAENLVVDPNLMIIGGDFDFQIGSFDAALEEANADLALLDGAYLLKVEGRNRTEKAAEAFNTLKRACKRHKLPICVSQQFNREAKKGKAKTSTIENISLTDVAGWNADLAFALVQTEVQRDKGVMTVQTMKGREAVIPSFNTNWNFDMMDFTDADYEGGDADEQGADDNDEDPIF